MVKNKLGRNIRVVVLVVLLIGVINIIALLDFPGSFFSESQTLTSVEERKTFNAPATTLFPLLWKQDENGSSGLLFHSLHEAHKFMNSTPIANLSRIIIRYPNFQRRLPLFINESDRELFLKSPVIQDNLRPNTYEQLRGVVQVVPNGTFKMEYQCGYRSQVDYFQEPRISVNTQHVKILAPLIIPMAFLFQHFLDGTLPKIVQALPLILNPEVTLLLERPVHSIVMEILYSIGVREERILWSERGDTRTVFTADYMLFLCVAPPLHPLLWKEMRKLLRVKDDLAVPKPNAFVMLMSRSGASNNRRRILNFGQVQKYLQQRYSTRLVTFHSAVALAQALDVFSKTLIIIATHGGALYNMYFASLNTTIIEFAPVLYGGRDVHALPHAIFWASASVIGQMYWRVPSVVANGYDDMVVDIHKLHTILNVIEQQTL